MSKFYDVWLPGLAFMVAGALLGWLIARGDTQTLITGVVKANMQLQQGNGALYRQQGVLQTQIAILRDQKDTLGKLLKEAAATDRDIKLVLDTQGHVLGGQLITDSEGRAILDSSRHPIVGHPKVPAN